MSREISEEVQKRLLIELTLIMRDHNPDIPREELVKDVMELHELAVYRGKAARGGSSVDD